MLVSIRPELHERYPYDAIPASDYQIEAEEFAKIGASKEWPDKAGALKRLPTALYIGENVSWEACNRAITEVNRRTGRWVSATMQAGEEIFFFNLEDAPPKTSLSAGWLEALGSVTAYETLAGLSQRSYKEDSYASVLDDSTGLNSWIAAATGATSKFK